MEEVLFRVEEGMSVPSTDPSDVARGRAGIPTLLACVPCLRWSNCGARCWVSDVLTPVHLGLRAFYFCECEEKIKEKK